MKVVGPFKRSELSNYAGRIVFRPLDLPGLIGGAAVLGNEAVATTADGLFEVDLAPGRWAVTFPSAPGAGTIYLPVPSVYPDGETEIAVGDIASLAELLPAAPGDAKLLEWAAEEAFQITGPAYDAQGRLTGGPVVWPDGSAGVLTVAAWSGDGLVNAWAVTYAPRAKTITQGAVTRNASGDITTIPALTIS